MDRPTIWFRHVVAMGATAAMLLVSLAGAGGCLAAEFAVAEELERLAGTEGFGVDGMEHLGEASAWADAGDVYPRVRMLLDRFDYIILQTHEGQIKRVIVLGEKRLGSAVEMSSETRSDGPGAGMEETGRIVLETRRVGGQHLVEVSFEKVDDKGEAGEAAGSGYGSNIGCSS